MLSRVLRFTFPAGSTISSAAFLKLRQQIAAAGAASQYYGYTTPTRVLSLPRKRHEVCWVIHWPDERQDLSAAFIRLRDDAPLEDEALQKSMHKTYSDTYQIIGFTGGYWAYALNSNETAGVPCSSAVPETIPKPQRRLGVYYLGWDSIEAFSNELDKLQPYFGPGSGAFYTMLRQHK
ncbi:hypothetical protein V8C34DRAFT_318191 [Trichoderma compactum]